MAFLNEQGLQRLWQHIVTKLSNKVDSEEGKGLSTNDFTNEDKQKLEALNDVATTEYVDTKLTSTVTVDLTNIDSSVTAQINADLLGGITADNYALKGDIEQLVIEVINPDDYVLKEEIEQLITEAINTIRFASEVTF